MHAMYRMSLTIRSLMSYAHWMMRPATSRPICENTAPT